MDTMDAIIGWWDLSWKGGTFAICFRPAGYFFCPKFQAPARWTLEGDQIKLDWAKFGKYAFTFSDGADGKAMEGQRLLVEEDENSWRKAAFQRELSPSEKILIGDGAGSEWDFEWSGGSFPVQFKADGYNHFKCEDFPAHAHWSLDDDKLFINWAEYGNYELTIDAEAQNMSGSLVGGDESEWRKARFLRNLLDNKVVEACSYHH